VLVKGARLCRPPAAALDRRRHRRCVTSAHAERGQFHTGPFEVIEVVEIEIVDVERVIF
jgi:hypothetical protein